MQISAAVPAPPADAAISDAQRCHRQRFSKAGRTPIRATRAARSTSATGCACIFKTASTISRFRAFAAAALTIAAAATGSPIATAGSGCLPDHAGRVAL